MAKGITPDIEVPSDVTNDASVTGGAKRVDISARKRTRKSADKPPKAAAPKPLLSGDITTAQIEDALAEVLTFPAVPCAMAGDEWASEHFTNQGRVFAANLAKASERNPTLRRWCERAVIGEGMAMVAMSGCMYLLPPLIHWGFIPMPNEAKEMLGIPVKLPADSPGDTAAQAMSDVHRNGSNESNA